MRDRHPRSASGYGRCSGFFFSLGWPPFLVVVWVSAVLADRDGRRVLVTGAQGLVARVVGEDDAAGAQLVVFTNS